MKSKANFYRLALLWACTAYSLVLDGNFNSSLYLFPRRVFDSLTLDTFSRTSSDQFYDASFSLSDDAHRHTFSTTGYVYKRVRTEDNYKYQVPVLNYQYRSANRGLYGEAGRFNEITDFNFFQMDGAALAYNFLESWQAEAAVGALVDSALYFGGRDNLAGYAALKKTFLTRNSVKMTLSRATRDNALIANDAGLHLRLNTEKKWHLSLGGKITQAGKNPAQLKGIKFTESYSRLTYTPKKLKYQFYVGTRSYHPSLYDPTDFYYFEYLYYDKFFVGSRVQLPLKSTLEAQASAIQTAGKTFGNVSVYWAQNYFGLKLEKGVGENQNDYLIDGQARYLLLERLRLVGGGSVVHHQTRANSFPGASDLNNLFTSVYVASELNMPRSLWMRVKLENRTNRERVYDLRLFLHLSYAFTTEERERFPWEY